MSMEKNVPEIRFKGFSGDWLNYSLDQITEVYDGTHQTPTYTKTGVTFLSAENIKTLTSNKFISEEAFKKEFKIYPKKNDVLMTRIGDVGTANVVETDEDKAYYVTLALLKYKQLSPYFLKSSISSPFVQRDIWLRTLHIAFPKKINMNEIKKVSVNCPTDGVESDDIGNYFQKLDNLINQHQQKHDKLSSIKKAMLEKMFPKQGETIPEIRFKGFGGEWRETDLAGACSNFQSGKFIRAEDIKENGAYPVYGGNGLRGFCSAYNHEGIYALIGRQGALCGNMNLSHGKAFFTEHAIAVQANKDCDTLFLFYKLGTMNLGQYSGQSAQPGLSVTNLIKLIIFVPEYREQTKIGNYFQKLDTLINQHQQQITKLNNIKQACLSKMFV